MQGNGPSSITRLQSTRLRNAARHENAIPGTDREFVANFDRRASTDSVSFYWSLPTKACGSNTSEIIAAHVADDQFVADGKTLQDDGCAAAPR